MDEAGCVSHAHTIAPQYYDRGDRDNPGASCAICAAECVPLHNLDREAETDGSWMCFVKLFTDDTILFDHDGLLRELPQPIRVGRRKARLLSASQHDQCLPHFKALQSSWGEALGGDRFLLTGGAPDINPDGRDWGGDHQEKWEGPQVFVYRDKYFIEQPWYYVPVHEACQQLVKRAASRHTACDRIWAQHTERQVPEILQACLRAPVAVLPLEMQVNQRYRANPVDVAPYGETLASTAPVLDLDTSDEHVPRFQQLLDNLPVELYDRIIDYVRGMSRASSMCTRLVSNATWKQWLLQRDLLPYLWDLDANKLFAAPRVDFEMTVRELARLGTDRSSDKASMSTTLPMGLLNRVRIWRIIEQCLGDTSSCLLETVSQRSSFALVDSGSPRSTPASWTEEQLSASTKENVFTSLSYRWVRRTVEEIDDWERSRRGARGGFAGTIGRSGGHWMAAWRRERGT